MHDTTAAFNEEVSHVAFVVVSGLPLINREGPVGSEIVLNVYALMFSLYYT